ncbi:MAG: DUF642 domain-containing protein [Thermogutta sp.]
MRLIDLASRREVRRFRVPGGTYVLRSLLFSTDGKWLAWGDYGRVHLFDVESGRHISSLRGYESNFDSLAFSPDGRYLAGANVDKQVTVWSQASWLEPPSENSRATFQIGAHSGPVSSVAFWPLSNVVEDSENPVASGDIVLATASGSHVYLWDVPKRQQLYDFKQSSNRSVRGVAWSPADGTLLAACGDGFVWLMDGIPRRDSDPGKTIREIDVANETALLELQFAPDGRTFAARDAYSIRIWETGIYENQTGKLLRVIVANSGLGESAIAAASFIHSFAFTPDGKRLVFSHGLGTISVADLATGEISEMQVADPEHISKEAIQATQPNQPEPPRHEYLLRQIQGLLQEVESLRAQGRPEEAHPHREKAAYRAPQLAELLRQPVTETPERRGNLVVNGSFELRTTGLPPRNIETLQPGSTLVKGWQTFDPRPKRDDGLSEKDGEHRPLIVDWIGPERWKASHGSCCLDIDGGIGQSIPTETGRTYALRFDFAGSPETDGTIQQSLRVETAGDPHEFQFDPTGSATSDLRWVTRVVVFTAKQNATDVRFVNARPNVHSAGVALDVVSAVPLSPAIAQTARELFKRSMRFEREAAGLRVVGGTEQARQHAEAAERHRAQLNDLLQRHDEREPPAESAIPEAGVRFILPSLLIHEAVQSDLALSDKQRERVRRIARQFQDDITALMNELKFNPTVIPAYEPVNDEEKYAVVSAQYLLREHKLRTNARRSLVEALTIAQATRLQESSVQYALFVEVLTSEMPLPLRYPDLRNLLEWPQRTWDHLTFLRFGTITILPRPGSKAYREWMIEHLHHELSVAEWSRFQKLVGRPFDFETLDRNPAQNREHHQ